MKRKINIIVIFSVSLLFFACGGDSGNSSNRIDSSSSGSAWATTLIDFRDNQTYKTVVIGAQTWMAENLNYAVDSSWCYDNSADSCAKYGRLYQWARAMALNAVYNTTGWSGSDVDHQGICPVGWHVPNDNEWQIFFNYIQENKSSFGFVASLAALSEWELYWEGKNKSADLFGFVALPAGYRYGNGTFDMILI